ncbi:MAG: phosphoglucosamine mutase [Acidobacteria bacterium]|nr:phosphoglucosamine mutase [Acidobacteriota bacterium]
MRQLFGTDGIRGVANRHPMTAEMAVRVGMALAQTCRQNGEKRRPQVVIGKDTRLSGYMLETALASGVISMGGDVLLCGPLPTPGVSFITTSMRADAGVMISASHNPYRDNGIKVFGPDGFKLPDGRESEIERLIGSGADLERRRVAPGRIGQAHRIDDALGRYVVELKHTFPRGRRLDGVKVVIDAANGAAYRSAPLVFRELGADVVALNVRPDGRNINRACGALHPARVCSDVRRLGARVGIALDGDADRVIVSDERGRVVDGDAIMAILASDMLRRGELARKTLVVTVMSNLGLVRAVERAGGKLERTAVGDRYVVERMRAGGFNFGGEQSGHLIFLDHAPTGDGVLGALQLLAVLLRSGRPLSALVAEVFRPYPQVLLNFKVACKPPVEDLPATTKAIRAAERAMGRDGRIVVRYSGTELLARVMVEGKTRLQVNAVAKRIAETMRREVLTA